MTQLKVVLLVIFANDAKYGGIIRRHGMWNIVQNKTNCKVWNKRNWMKFSRINNKDFG